MMLSICYAYAVLLKLNNSVSCGIMSRCEDVHYLECRFNYVFWCWIYQWSPL